MFTPSDRLPLFDPQERGKYRRRWQGEEGRALREKILEMIRAGAGEDFLQWEFEEGRLGFLEGMWDLKGLDIFKERIVFPDGDTFEAIDFSYGHLYHSVFENALFNCTLDFVRVYNCEFRSCIFSFNHFYGATLEKVKFVDCEFIEGDSFTNCDLRDVVFDNCFVPERLFFDCRFDEVTRIGDPIVKPLRMQRAAFKKEAQAEIFKGIREGYVNGEVSTLAREYLFRQMQSVTRYNTKSLIGRIFGYFKEYVAGYGVRPGRVLAAMALVLLGASIVFATQLGFEKAIILSSGALFTFGAYSEALGSLGMFYRLAYIGTAFLGVSLTALFITVLANVWFRER